MTIRGAGQIARQKESAEERSIKHIKNPKGWFHWPRLPMKRGYQNQQMGVLVPQTRRDEDGNHICGYKVYLCNLYNKISVKTPYMAYESAEKVVADGWRVD